MNKQIAFSQNMFFAGKEVPPELRQQLEQLAQGLVDKCADGGPHAARRADQAAVHVATAQQFVINGHRYSSLEEMPPAERKLFEQLRGALLVPALGGHQPDRLPGTLVSESLPGSRAFSGAASPSAPTLLSPGAEPSQLSWLVEFFVLIFGIAIGLAIAVWVWFALK